jgi:hypothetical protein
MKILELLEREIPKLKVSEKESWVDYTLFCIRIIILYPILYPELTRKYLNQKLKEDASFPKTIESFQKKNILLTKEKLFSEMNDYHKFIFNEAEKEGMKMDFYEDYFTGENDMILFFNKGKINNSLVKGKMRIFRNLRKNGGYISFEGEGKENKVIFCYSLRIDSAPESFIVDILITLLKDLGIS